MNRDLLKQPDRKTISGNYRMFFILIAMLMVTAVFLTPFVAAGKPANPPGKGKCRTEVCDGKDNDCDLLIDEGCLRYCDNDGDGYRGKSAETLPCDGTGCWNTGCSYTVGNDCNDANAAINPGAAEKCGNGIDENCNGMTDDICIDPSICAELFPGTNVANANRVNVVFVGMLFDTKEQFQAYAQNSVDYYGTLPGTGIDELAVYKDNKNKFNFWYINKILTPSSSPPFTSCTQCSSSEASLYCTGLANKYVINLCNTSFRGCAYFGGSSFVATAGGYGSNVPYVVDHEFQHQFPRLYDEYTEGSSSMTGQPNCADTLGQAQSWWGDLYGQTAEGYTVGYYDGCSYVTGNYRPTSNSIMRDWIFALGLVNQRHVASDLSAFSGAPSATPSNAVEVVLIGDPSDADSYTVTDIRPVTYKSPVMVDSYKHNTVEVKVKDTINTQNFDTYEDLVTEDFSTSNSIKLVAYDKVPQPIITVTVPTGAAVYNKATKKFDIGNEKGVPFTVSVKKQNGNGKTVYSSD